MSLIKTVLAVVGIALVTVPAILAGEAPAQSPEPGRNTLNAVVAAQDELHAHELAYLKHELDSLKLLVARLMQDSRTSQGNDSVLACVSDELSMLKFENLYLRTMLQATFAQYASTDDEDELAKPQLAALSLSLSELNDNVQTILDKRTAAQPRPEEKPSSIMYSGWIDVSNSTEYNTNRSNFNLDQAELDVATDLTNRGSVRADIEYKPDQAGELSLGLEQAYFNYALGADKQWAFTFGKFNSPVGFEKIDPEDLYLYSFSTVRRYGLPTNLTGVMSSWSPAPSFNAKLWLANGWDVDADNNKDKTVGACLNLIPASSFTAGFSALYGPEQDNNVSSKREVYDAVLTWAPVNNVSFGADVTLGNESHVLGTSGIASWSGAMILSQISVTPHVQLFGRFDYFNDEDGVRTGTAQECKAIALSPNMWVTDAFAAGLEVRYDWSNRLSYVTSSGAPRNNQVSTALQFSYGF